MKFYEVLDRAPARINRVAVLPGDVIQLDPGKGEYHRGHGHVREVSPGQLGKPLAGITEAERAALPRLEPLGPGEGENVLGQAGGA